jgi:5-methylthioribose kinase
MGLATAHQHPEFASLAGGVSSDIWQVELTTGDACIKRALAKLKVAADWRAPVERSNYECKWIETVGGIEPDAVPRILGHDADAGLFVMDYLNPDQHPVWKHQLRDGIAELKTASAVGQILARVHAATAGDRQIAAAFDTTFIFFPLRLEPYLLATARAHPDRRATFEDLVTTTQANCKALVHGDVSPKNILVGLDGPIFLDAEGAWYGDPAFDAAFCLNHLLLKCTWNRPATEGFLACFEALASSYVQGCTWEPSEQLEARVAHLLPALFLARVDGKSPVEYITDENDKNMIRRTARRLLAAPVDRLSLVRDAWARELAG